MTSRVLRGLVSSDLRNFGRDPLLFYIPLIPFLMALGFRFAVPVANTFLQERVGFNLEPYYPLIVAMFLYIVPSITGIMVGFLLLDEKDENTLLALLVTPIPFSQFLAYRILLPMFLGTLVTLLSFPLLNLVQVAFLDLLVVTLLASLTAPLYALFLSSFVSNKVAGFNMIKFANGLLMLPIAAYFLPMPLQLVSGLIPHYWGMKVLWLALEHQPYGGYALTGVVHSLGLLAFFLRQFRRSVHA
jgi:fluoroquinolone transport system permease protein